MWNRDLCKCAAECEWECGCDWAVITKEWHSLTDDEIDEIVVNSETLLAKDIARAIEVKLKEKNHE